MSRKEIFYHLCLSSFSATSLLPCVLKSFNFCHSHVCVKHQTSTVGSPVSVKLQVTVTDGSYCKFTSSEYNLCMWKDKFFGAALLRHYVINMQPRLFDLFWMAPSVHSHLHKAQWDEWRYHHTHSGHHISRAGSMFALSSWHISFAGTASDI